MFRASIVLFFISLSAQAEVCTPYVKTFNVYKQKEKGKVVKKHTIAELSDWSRNGQFQGFLLTDKAPEKVAVIVESQPNLLLKSVVTKGMKISTWSRDKKYREVAYDTVKYLGEAPTQDGSYTVKVLSEGKELCSETKLIVNDSH